jgi:hypothetical protein
MHTSLLAAGAQVAFHIPMQYILVWCACTQAQDLPLTHATYLVERLVMAQQGTLCCMLLKVLLQCIDAYKVANKSAGLCASGTTFKPRQAPSNSKLNNPNELQSTLVTLV